MFDKIVEQCRQLSNNERARLAGMLLREIDSNSQESFSTFHTTLLETENGELVHDCLEGNFAWDEWE